MLAATGQALNSLVPNLVGPLVRDFVKVMNLDDVKATLEKSDMARWLRMVRDAHLEAG